MPEELAGILASGNRYRVTPYSVEITSPDGVFLKQADVNTLVGVGRNGASVLIRDRNGQAFELTTTSLDEAGRIEHLLRRTVTPMAVASTIAPATRSAYFRKVWIGIGLAVVGCVGLAFMVALFGESDDDSGNLGSSSDTVRVVYRVTDSSPSGTASLNYENAGGNTEQVEDADTPWEERLSLGRGGFAYVSAQRQGPGSGTVRCTISVDGEVVEEAESTGQFVIATCSGSVP